ncbi:hypothetical protein JTB14_032372 [Gonioctena quinquepunctata]|nr:hypothetical protein JTB14_032372 [Gonioctena quinquepunctata]
MNQIIKLLIAVIGFSSAIAYLLEEDFGDKFLPLTKIWHDQCMVITGAKQESIYTVREGVFDDNDEKMKRYILCLWMVAGVVNKDMVFDFERMKSWMPSNHACQHYLICWKKTRESGEVEPHELVWKFEKCVQKAIPETFVMF